MIEDIFFKDPIFLWLFLFFPIIILWYFFTKNKSQPLLKISSTKGFETESNFFLKSLRFLPFLFRVLALLLIVLAIVRPQSVDVSTRTKTN